MPAAMLQAIAEQQRQGLQGVISVEGSRGSWQGSFEGLCQQVLPTAQVGGWP